MKALVMCCGHTLGWPYPHQQSKSYRWIPQKLPAFLMNLSSLVGNCIRSWEQYGKIRMTVDTEAQWPNPMTSFHGFQEVKQVLHGGSLHSFLL